MNLVILCTAVGYILGHDYGAALGAAIGAGFNLLLNAVGWPLKVN